MGWRDRLRYWLPNRKESDSDRDGFLSTVTEGHALLDGLRAGLLTSVKSFYPVPKSDDARREDRYYFIGYLSGTLLQAGILAGSSWGIVDLRTGAIPVMSMRVTLPLNQNSVTGACGAGHPTCLSDT